MCQTCGISTSGSVCGCGTSCCTPWAVASNCYHCPPPPSPTPCGFRTNEDGSIEPVWHPVHPFLPYLWENYRSELADAGYDYPTCKEDWRDRKQEIDCYNLEIAAMLRRIELETSTCDYGVANYFKAIALQLLARLELKLLKKIFRTNAYALSSMGKQVDFTKSPSIKNTEYWQLLNSLKKQTSRITILGL